jgi:hypothetical protein
MFVLGVSCSFPGPLAFVPALSSFDMGVARRVLPLTLVYVAWITLTNVCLQYVEVSFYQLVKSLNIIFNIALQYKMLGAVAGVFFFFMGIEIRFREGRWRLSGKHASTLTHHKHTNTQTHQAFRPRDP